MRATDDQRVGDRRRGNGGKVILWSDRDHASPAPSSRSAASACGNGGFVEVSSKGVLNYTGNVDTRAPNGKSARCCSIRDDITISAWSGHSTVRGRQLHAGRQLRFINVVTLQNALG